MVTPLGWLLLRAKSKYQYTQGKVPSCCGCKRQKFDFSTRYNRKYAWWTKVLASEQVQGGGVYYRAAALRLL